MDWQHSTEPVQALAYSPNGRFLAAGCRDHNIYIYTVEVDRAAFKGSDDDKLGGGKGASGATSRIQGGAPVRYMRHAVCRGHTGPVGQLDFGRESLNIQSCGMGAFGKVGGSWFGRGWRWGLGCWLGIGPGSKGLGYRSAPAAALS